MTAEMPAVSAQINMHEATERIQAEPMKQKSRNPLEEFANVEEITIKEEKSTGSSNLSIFSIEETPSTGTGSPSSTAGSTIDVMGNVENGKPSTDLNAKEEGFLAFLIQTCIPFLLAGLGMVGAGMLLNKWNNGLFLRNMPEAIVLIPALSGLKGNLEMTLASRLSTMAHLGQIDRRSQKLRAFYSNLAVDQAQAIIVSIVASFLAIGTQLAEGKTIPLERALCLMVAATLTATVTSLFLASLMLSLTFAAHTVGLNPDNISTPIAAALGDLTSLASFVFFGTLLYPVRQTMTPLLYALLALLLTSSLVWMWMASREEGTRKVLKVGWFPVLGAMCLSSAAGAILQNSIGQFEGIGLFQPLINGVGGNLVAVQSSKICTNLFKTSKYGQLPANRLLTYVNPLRIFFKYKERESMNGLVLLAFALPGHFLFVGLILLANAKAMDGLMNPQFMALYMLAALVQVYLLLYFCQILCRALWLCGQNPDINSIPLLTAMGDLFGSLLLASAFGLNALWK